MDATPLHIATSVISILAGLILLARGFKFDAAAYCISIFFVISDLIYIIFNVSVFLLSKS